MRRRIYLPHGWTKLAWVDRSPLDLIDRQADALDAVDREQEAWRERIDDYREQQIERSME